MKVTYGKDNEGFQQTMMGICAEGGEWLWVDYGIPENNIQFIH